MIAFHRALIGTAIFFFTMFAFWELSVYLDGRSALALVLAIGSALVAVGLGYYLKNLRRFLGR